MEAAKADPAGDRIVLLTDGEENEDPRVAVVKPGILAKGIVVDTILLTGQASPVLISLAAETGTDLLQFLKPQARFFCTWI